MAEHLEDHAHVRAVDAADLCSTPNDLLVVTLLRWNGERDVVQRFVQFGLVAIFADQS